MLVVIKCHFYDPVIIKTGADRKYVKCSTSAKTNLNVYEKMSHRYYDSDCLSQFSIKKT